MIPLTSRILQPNWHVLYQWIGRQEEQILRFFLIFFFFFLILLILWACWDHMSVWAGLSGTGVVSRLALPQRAQPVELTRDWSCLWNRASRSTQMAGWLWGKHLAGGEKREEGAGWKKRKRSAFFSQLYFFKIRKKKRRGVTKNKNDKKENKKPHPNQHNNRKSHPKPTKPPIQKYTDLSIDPIYPFQRQAGALTLPLTKAPWAQESRSSLSCQLPESTYKRGGPRGLSWIVILF